MILLLGFAFLSGLVTILAPCIWPVLPIVLSSSLASKGHQRPLGITLGVMLSFTIFTLSVSYLIRIFHLDPNILRIFAVVVIGGLGVTMVIPALNGKFEVMVSRLANIFGQNTSGQGSGFLPGLITGLSLGLVWSPCAGPILATIATLAAVGQVNLDVIFVTLAYVIGIGIPLFAFAYGGQLVVSKTRGISQYTGRIQQIFGVIMILAAVAIYTNYDKTVQLQLLNKFPALGTALNGFESSQVVKQQLDVLRGKKTSDEGETNGLFNANTPAPDFVGITHWLNPEKPLTIKDLKGKVVLVDFWTYTCINCIRTLPHVTAWYDKYKDDGFVVVGVHTPEFAFEKETNNVENAIKQYSIHYPVAQDNNFATWNAYSNQYWPAEYLIDAQGNIRRTHFGEGEYDEMEEAIQTLLKENGKKVSAKLSTMADETPKRQLSPETYLGTDRMEYYYPNGTISDGIQTLTLHDDITPNSFSFGGNWDVMGKYSTPQKNAILNYNFTADKVFLVMKLDSKTPKTGAQIKVYLNGKLVDKTNAGEDVKDGIVTVTKDNLYRLINLEGNTENHILKLEFSDPIQVFAFTFG